MTIWRGAALRTWSAIRRSGWVGLCLASPLGAQQPATRSLVEVWRIPADGQEYSISSVNGLAMSADGRVYVLSPPERTILVFDAQGKFLRRIGRRGDGPGEFTWPVTIGVVGDLLWVGDGTHRRITLFTPTGELVQTMNLASVGEPHLLRTGEYLTVPGVRPRIGGVQHRLIITRHRAQASTGESIVDTTLHIKTLGVDLGGTQFLGRQPFDDSPLWAIGRDGNTVLLVDRGVATGNRGTFRVLKLDAQGTVVYDVRIPYAASLLSNALVAKRVDQITGQLRERHRDIPPALLREMVGRAVYTPRFKPTVTAVHVAFDGTVWIRREEPDDGVARWTVLDGAGRSMYDVRLPEAAVILWANAENVLASIPGESDLPEMVRFRVR